jgi:hypothetical protein
MKRLTGICCQQAEERENGLEREVLKDTQGEETEKTEEVRSPWCWGKLECDCTG